MAWWPAQGHVKVKFKEDEDIRLQELVERFGTDNWSAVAAEMRNRNARQCRDRWSNYVNPKIENSPWTKEEERLLEERHAHWGTKWCAIAHFFPNRSKNDIKYRCLRQQRAKEQAAA
jgi:hypothetical protein